MIGDPLDHAAHELVLAYALERELIEAVGNYVARRAVELGETPADATHAAVRVLAAFLAMTVNVAHGDAIRAFEP